MAKHRRKRDAPINWAVWVRTCAAVVGAFVALVRLILGL